MVLDACPKLVQLLLAEGRIRQLHASPDGKELTTIYQDPRDPGNLRLQRFDTESGKQVWPPRSHSFFDAVLAFHGNSGIFATISNSVIQIRDTQTEEPISTLRDFSGPVTKAALSPAAEAILVVQSNTVRLWNSRSGEPLTPPLPQPGIVSDADFSPDGSRFAVTTYTERKWTANISTSEDGQMRVWDTRTGRPITPVMELGPRRIRECVFSPDGQVLLSVDDDLVQVWDPETGKAVGPTTWDESLEPINQVSFSSDSRRIVTASGDQYRTGGARVWQTHTGKPLTPLLRHHAQVNHAVFSPGGDLVATASADHFARVWEVETGLPLTPQLSHEASIVAVTFAPDGRRLITGTATGLIRIWDLAGQKVPHSLPHGGRRVHHAEFNRDGGKILTACYDGKARLWDSKTGELLVPPLDHGGKHRVVSYATFSADERRVLSIGGDLLIDGDIEVRVWNSGDGKLL